ncbi:hypothetical protein Btru_073988 [Bulinus truncatus]|nr:hypothetical protein Btru_073988 [Bulinus truncatus]
MMTNFMDVQNEELFLELRAEEVKELVMSDDLTVYSEDDVLVALMKWVEHAVEAEVACRVTKAPGRTIFDAILYQVNGYRHGYSMAMQCASWGYEHVGVIADDTGNFHALSLSSRNRWQPLTPCPHVKNRIKIAIFLGTSTISTSLAQRMLPQQTLRLEGICLD